MLHGTLVSLLMLSLGNGGAEEKANGRKDGIQPASETPGVLFISVKKNRGRHAAFEYLRKLYK